MEETHLYSGGERKKAQCLKLYSRDNSRQKMPEAVVCYHSWIISLGDFFWLGSSALVQKLFWPDTSTHKLVEVQEISTKNDKHGNCYL